MVLFASLLHLPASLDWLLFMKTLFSLKNNMDQQSDPSTINQVIIIVEGAKEQVKFKKAYNVKAATALGIVHIMCGLIALGTGINVMDVDTMDNPYYYRFFGICGICASLLFLLSAGLTILGARIGSKCLVVASMVTDIISAIAGGILLIVSAMGIHAKLSWRRYYENHQNVCHQNINHQNDTPSYCDYGHHLDSPKFQQYYEFSPVSFALLVAMGATMLIIAIASASLTCLPLCCRPKKQGIVHYKPNQVLPFVFVLSLIHI